MQSITSIIRYFVLPESQIIEYEADLFPDHDFLPLTNLKVIKYPYPVDDGRYIVKADLPGYLINVMIDQCSAMGVTDPLSMEGIAAFDIADSYVGETREDVLEKFPELAGQVQAGTDEDGNPIMVDKFPIKKWSWE